MGSTSERPGLDFQTDKHDGFCKQLCSTYDRLDFMLTLSENKSDHHMQKCNNLHPRPTGCHSHMLGDHDRVGLPETAHATHVCYCNVHCFICAAFSSSHIYCQGPCVKSSSPGIFGSGGEWLLMLGRTTRQTTQRRRRSNPIQNLSESVFINLFRCSSS